MRIIKWICLVVILLMGDYWVRGAPAPVYADSIVVEDAAGLAVTPKVSMVLLVNSTLAVIQDEVKEIPAPYLEKEITMVPLRWVAEGLDAEIAWNDLTNGIEVTTLTTKAEFRVGQAEMTVNGQTLFSPIAVTMKEDTVYVPIRVMVEAFQQQIY